MSVVNPRRVFDWEGRPVGEVQSVVVHPRTRQPQSLLVRLDPEARGILGQPGLTIAVPYRFVAGMRRDQLVLGHNLRDLRGMGPGRPPGRRMRRAG